MADQAAGTPQTAPLPASLSKLTWKTNKTEDHRLSLDLPGELLATEIPFQGAKAYVYKDQQVIVMLMHYPSGSASDAQSLSLLTDGWADALGRRADVSDMKCSREQVSPCRILLNATFEYQGIPCEIEGLALMKEAEVWLATGQNRSGDTAVRWHIT